MKRIEFLKKKWVGSGKIAAAARLDHSLGKETDPFDLLFATDPSPKKIYVEFILRCYANREFLAEDVERISETLAVFHSNKRRLPVENRDIGTYASERDVWEMLSRAGVSPVAESGKQLKRSDRNRAHLESEVVYADGWTMALLKTPFAATWWGIGTRWCTTEKTGELYNNYASRGNLRVFVSPEGAKHQLHIGTGSLCDASDRAVEMGKFLPTLPEAFLPAIRRDVTTTFSGVDISDEHTFIYRRTALLALPKHLFEDETVAALDRMKAAGLSNLKLVSHEDGWTLKLAIGDLSSWAIRYDLGQQYDLSRDRRVPLARIEEPNGHAVSFDFANGSLKPLIGLITRMPIAFREAFLARCVKSWHGSNAEGGREIEAVLRLLPSSELSQSFWKAWAKKVTGLPKKSSDAEFGYIPEEALTLEVAHVFAKRGFRHRIPREMLTDGVAKALAKCDLSFLDDPEISGVLDKKQLANVFGSRNGDNLKDLPTEHRNPEMMRLVLEQCAGALGPAVKMVRTGMIDLDGMSGRDLIDELTMISLSERPASVSDVTVPLRRDVYLDVVTRSSAMLAWVPLEYRDVELCTAAVSGEQKDGLCHFPTWVVEEIRGAAAGAHGITHNYRPSKRYEHILKAAVKPDGQPAEALLPFRISAVAEPLAYRR